MGKWPYNNDRSTSGYLSRRITRRVSMNSRSVNTGGCHGGGNSVVPKQKVPFDASTRTMFLHWKAPLMGKKLEEEEEDGWCCVAVNPQTFEALGDHPFKSYLPTGTYSLVHTSPSLEGCMNFNPPVCVNQSKGWNKNGRISVPLNLHVWICSTIMQLQQVLLQHPPTVTFNIRGGGHCYNNTSLQGNNVLVYNDCFKSPVPKIPYTLPSDAGAKIRVLGDANISNSWKLELQSNIRIGDVFLYLDKYREAHGHSWDFPGGSCPNVGIAGFLMGGGQTYIGAHTGPACHYLQSVEGVSASGAVATFPPSSKHMKVMRGGGHCKPLAVTKFTMQLEDNFGNLGMPKSVEWQMMFFSTMNTITNSKSDQAWVKTFLYEISLYFKDENVLGPINIYSQKNTNTTPGAPARVVTKITVAFLEKKNGSNYPLDCWDNSTVGVHKYIYNMFMQNLATSATFGLPDGVEACAPTVVAPAGLQKWTLLLNYTNYLYKLYTEPIQTAPCNYGGTITTMWEWGENPNAFNDYTVNRHWTSAMGSDFAIQKNVATVDLTKMPDFLGLDHYVDFPGPFHGKHSVYPPENSESHLRWIGQLYAEVDGDPDYNAADMEQGVAGLFSVHESLISSSPLTNFKSYKYPNYPPTTIPTTKIPDISGNQLNIYFSDAVAATITDVKKGMDKTARFVSAFDP